MKKILKKMCASVLIISLATGNVSPINAEENVSDKEQLVLDITGTEEINTDICSDKDSVMIADGYEMLIDVPKNPSEPIYTTDGLGEETEMHLPVQSRTMEPELTENGTVMYSDNESDIAFNIEPLQVVGINEQTIEGLRTSIIIDNADCPKEYKFTFELEDGEKFVTAKELLGEEYDTGEVFVFDKDDNMKYIFEPAWAKDANGDSINSYYKIDGNSLFQVVDFNENTAFPVVADPSWWQITKCVAAVGVVIVGTIFSVAKIAKIKKYIKALGGVREAVLLMMGATTFAEKGAEVTKALGKLCAAILGVDTIIENCPGIKSTYNKVKKKLKK